MRGATTVELADDEVLLPGLVDTHVHVNEPGRTEWEGFATATRAAAAGGVTTLIDMPLNRIPPTCTVDALEVKRRPPQASARRRRLLGGAVPGNMADLRGLHDAGVFGFKCFMTDSGVEEFPRSSGDRPRCPRAGLPRRDDDRPRRGPGGPRPGTVAAGACATPTSSRLGRTVGGRRIAALIEGPGGPAPGHLLHLSSANAR